MKSEYINLGAVCAALAFLPPFEMQSHPDIVITDESHSPRRPRWKGPHTDPNYRGRAGGVEPVSKRKRRRDRGKRRLHCSSGH